jgi:prefoldin subunit 5
MVYTFDSLGYARRLRDQGVPQEQAEAHADAARDFIMAELVTKPDLHVALQAAIAPLERRMDKLETNMEKLEAGIETLSVRLTLRLGAMIVVAIGALATLLKLS